MENEITVTERIRLSQVLEVIGLLISNPSLSQEQACEDVGINVRTFQRWRERSSDVITEIQSTIHDFETEELATILAARAMILPGVLRDALSPLTDPSTRLRIYESMTKQQEQLADKVRTLEHNINPELFSGPQLEVKPSRFVTPSVDVTMKDGKFQVTIQQPEIVEAVTLPKPVEHIEEPS